MLGARASAVAVIRVKARRRLRCFIADVLAFSSVQDASAYRTSPRVHWLTSQLAGANRV
jgi:hypothetical protein